MSEAPVSSFHDVWEQNIETLRGLYRPPMRGPASFPAIICAPVPSISSGVPATVPRTKPKGNGTPENRQANSPSASQTYSL
jgi:hypothetical protein